MLRWIRFWLLVFMAGLVTSGVTAIPLTAEVNFLYRVLHHFGITSGPLHDWIQEVCAALLDNRARYPFLFYGTDWLAFGHFVIALAFVGPYRDPVRNIWVIQFGIFACLLVIPYAFIFGAIRQIPWWWSILDSAFGIAGLAALLIVQRLTKRLT